MAVLNQVRMAPGTVLPAAALAPKSSGKSASGKAVDPSRLTPVGPGWEVLNTPQKLALYPLAERWALLSEVQKRRWLALAQTFPTLPEQEQEKLHNRMTEWASLSAQQRNQARLNYADSNRLARDNKLAQWQAYQALSDEEKRKLAARAAPKPQGAATAQSAQDSAHPESAPARCNAFANGSRSGCGRPWLSRSISCWRGGDCPRQRACGRAYHAAADVEQHARDQRPCAPRGARCAPPYSPVICMPALSSPDAPASTVSAPLNLNAPSLVRRMACWMYEGILMFGVVFIAGYLFGTLSQTRNAMDNRHALQAFLFVVFGIYFTWFWAKGQTLAMKTWNIRVVDRAGRPLTQSRALLRYVLSWLWFLPPLVAVAPFSLPGAESTVIMLGWVAVWALLSRFHPQQQFWHDALAGTRLVHHEPTKK